VLLLAREAVEPLVIDLELRNALLAQILDRVEGLGIPVPGRALNERTPCARGGGILCRLEDVVKLLLERCGLGQWPVRVLLMAEDDVLEHGPGHTKQVRDFCVHLRALCRDNTALRVPPRTARLSLGEQVDAR
jgi:hypothetical protein